MRRLGERVGVPVVIADVRPDLLGGEWRKLLRQPVYIVVSDERFVAVLQKFFGQVTSAAENLRILIVGRDDIAAIPSAAPVYVMRAAMDIFAGAPIGGRIIPSARVFSAQAARDLVGYIVRANIDALSARTRTVQEGRARE